LYQIQPQERREINSVSIASYPLDSLSKPALHSYHSLPYCIKCVIEIAHLIL